MGGGSAQAFGGLSDSVTGGGGFTRGASVEVGEAETAIGLTITVEYGRRILQLLEKVRRHVINRIGRLVSLDVVEVNITVTDVLLPEVQSQLERQREVE